MLNKPIESLDIVECEITEEIICVVNVSDGLVNGYVLSNNRKRTYPLEFVKLIGKAPKASHDSD
jgi:hypothetical protein